MLLSAHATADAKWRRAKPKEVSATRVWELARSAKRPTRAELRREPDLLKRIDRARSQLIFEPVVSAERVFELARSGKRPTGAELRA
jgi:hypothetical protein